MPPLQAGAVPVVTSRSEPALHPSIPVARAGAGRQAWLSVALVLGLVHALVDATTVSVVLRSTRTAEVTRELAFLLVVGYDWIAFATQPLWGYLMDRWATPRSTRAIGLALCLASVPACGLAPRTAMVLAGLGNAVYHLGAGAAVLRLGLGRTLPAGLYVAPGALGLGFGMIYGKDVTLGPVWPLAVVLALGAAVAVALSDPPAAAGSAVEPGQAENAPGLVTTGPAPSVHERLGRWAFVLLLASIVVRSLVGMSASRGYPKGAWLMLGLPLVAFLGKAIGGFVADRWGWLETSVVALLLSAPFIGVSYEHPVLLLAGLLVFQMTMPVTLVAVARLMPLRLGTAFGWTCLALAVGSAPTMFGWGRPLCDRSVLLAWIAVSVTAVFFGLRCAGIGPRSAAERVRPQTVNP
jgi:FSR family fosmidomycin resistance protein-like MFS transporter